MIKLEMNPGIKSATTTTTVRTSVVKAKRCHFRRLLRLRGHDDGHAVVGHGLGLDDVAAAFDLERVGGAGGRLGGVGPSLAPVHDRKVERLEASGTDVVLEKIEYKYKKSSFLGKKKHCFNLTDDPAVAEDW